MLVFMDAFFILIFLSLIILLGAIGEFFFRKTGIPDVLWLLIIGIVGNYLFEFQKSLAVQQLIPIFIVLTLIIILFDGGLNLRLGNVVKNSGSAFLIAIIYFIFSVGLITGITYLLHIFGVLVDWNIWSGIILGAILGGTSSAIVLPLVNLAKLNEKLQDILSVESAFNDALCIVVVFTLLDYLGKAGTSSLGLIFKNIAASFAIGIVLGVIVGLLWLYLLKKLSSEEGITQYFYVLTLSLLILLYVLTEYLGGSAVISIFVFGLIMGSTELLNKLFKANFYVINHDIVLINKQIAFLIKSFFFVLIGTMFVFIFGPFLIAILLVIILVLARFLTILIPKSTRTLEHKERRLLYFFTPKGLAAGLLAISLAAYANILPGTSIIGNIVFSVIILSVIISTISLFFYRFWPKKQDSTQKLQQANQ